MARICPNCKTTNSENASFCQNCGENLLQANQYNRKSGASGTGGPTNWWNKQGTGTKAAIGIAGVCCIGLILIIAFGGMFSPDSNTANTTNTQPSTPNTPSPAPTAKTWHSVATYTGTGNKNTPSFQIKGTKFKVSVTATASSLQYGRFGFFAYPEGETKSYVGEGSIDSFNQTTQNDEFEITAGPGSYYLSVLAANMANWKTEIFDYY